MFKYDTVHGRYQGTVEATGPDSLKIDGNDVKVFGERDPSNIKWASCGTAAARDPRRAWRR